jgi:hypothetical protein
MWNIDGGWQRGAGLPGARQRRCCWRNRRVGAGRQRTCQAQDGRALLAKAQELAVELEHVRLVAGLRRQNRSMGGSGQLFGTQDYTAG